MKINAFILFIIIPSVCFSEFLNSNPTPQHTISPQATFTPVVQIGIHAYKFSKINWFEGYFITGLMYGDSPEFSLFFQEGKKKRLGGLNIQQEHLETVLSQSSIQEVNSNKDFLENFKKFAPSDIVQSGFMMRNGMKLLRYDYLDANRKIRMSGWYDEESGFLMQRAVYDETGELRTFKIYLKLAINTHRLERPRFKKQKHGRHHKFNKKFKNQDDLQELRKMGEKILAELHSQ